ncbi:MAG: hypothetical protein J0I43_11555 [Microbacterium sp.]|uniref:hypothetical protein n=1 Tax=Microbacterium sp. TaxID=51671 RepID=UPI001AC29489|nr:hypothetical protein [Microbacterium sp.]MBN9177986.1 hypothetical protein [Microbacterium sp.]
MSTTTSAPPRRPLFARTLLALAAAVAIGLAPALPASASTGAQTGEWDVVAASAAQSPRLQSYDHENESWDTVTSPDAWFAVGSGKVIDESETATTPVAGGGIRFQNTASGARAATFTFRIPANVGLNISNGTLTVVNSPATAAARTVTWTTPSVAAGATWHEHLTWTFSGSGTSSAANIGVSVSVPGSGGFSASTTYRFTF